MTFVIRFAFLSSFSFFNSFSWMNEISLINLDSVFHPLSSRMDSVLFVILLVISLMIAMRSTKVHLLISSFHLLILNTTFVSPTNSLRSNKTSVLEPYFDSFSPSSFLEFWLLFFSQSYSFSNTLCFIHKMLLAFCTRIFPTSDVVTAFFASTFFNVGYTEKRNHVLYPQQFLQFFVKNIILHFQSIYIVSVEFIKMFIPIKLLTTCSMFWVDLFFNYYKIS